MVRAAPVAQSTTTSCASSREMGVPRAGELERGGAKAIGVSVCSALVCFLHTTAGKVFNFKRIESDTANDKKERNRRATLSPL